MKTLDELRIAQAALMVKWNTSEFRNDLHAKCYPDLSEAGRDWMFRKAKLAMRPKGEPTRN